MQSSTILSVRREVGSMSTFGRTVALSSDGIHDAALTLALLTSSSAAVLASVAPAATMVAASTREKPSSAERRKQQMRDIQKRRRARQKSIMTQLRLLTGQQVELPERDRISALELAVERYEVLARFVHRSRRTAASRGRGQVGAAGQASDGFGSTDDVKEEKKECNEGTYLIMMQSATV